MGDGVSVLTIVVDQTPHTCLSPNQRVHERRKAEHRKTLKAAAVMAMHNALVQAPEMAQELGTGPIRLRMRIEWERGRKRADSDNALASLKGLVDGIAQKLDRTDAAFVFDPVEQIVTEERQGRTMVTIERIDR